MSHQSSSGWSSQQAPISPFSPPNDPAEPVQPPPSKDYLPQHLPASPPTTSASPSHFDGSGASSPRHLSAQLMSPATSPNDTVAPSPLSGPAVLDPPADESALRSSSKHRLSQDDSDFEPSKRQRTDHDRNDSDSAQSSQPSPSDFAPFYRLGTTAFSVLRPHPALNLPSLYGLDKLSASVARKHPVTGDKINKLRKSYEGKIKDFPGKNKAVASEGELFSLLNYPQEEWDIHQVQGKEIESVLSLDQTTVSDDFMARLAPALALPAGPLPEKEAEHWRSIIDLDNMAAKGDKPPNPAKDKGTPTNPAASPTSDSLRPRRRGTKRNYHDESFEGYEESFDDLGDGMSIDDDDRKSTTSSNARRRKRQRDAGSASHFSGSLTQFAPTTVSVSR